jgi:hypothetical protein
MPFEQGLGEPILYLSELSSSAVCGIRTRGLGISKRDRSAARRRRAKCVERPCERGNESPRSASEGIRAPRKTRVDRRSGTPGCSAWPAPTSRQMR